MEQVQVPQRPLEGVLLVPLAAVAAHQIGERQVVPGDEDDRADGKELALALSTSLRTTTCGCSAHPWGAWRTRMAASHSGPNSKAPKPRHEAGELPAAKGHVQIRLRPEPSPTPAAPAGRDASTCTVLLTPKKLAQFEVLMLSGSSKGPRSIGCCSE